MSEFHAQQRRMQALLEQPQVDALLLGRVSSFAWQTVPVEINGQTFFRAAILERK